MGGQRQEALEVGGDLGVQAGEEGLGAQVEKEKKGGRGGERGRRGRRRGGRREFVAG